MVQKLKELDKLIEQLALLFAEDDYDGFVMTMATTDSFLLDIIFHLNARQQESDLIDAAKEVVGWFEHIYKFKRFKLDINGKFYSNFTLRNLYDVMLFEIILHKLLYINYLNKNAFCDLFENLPEYIYDKIDDLRETSFKSRDSDMHKRSLIKAKYISFEYFNNLKNY